MCTEKNPVKKYGKSLTMINKTALWVIKIFYLYTFLRFSQVLIVCIYNLYNLIAGRKEGRIDSADEIIKAQLT